MADYELIDVVYIIAFVLVVIGGLNWGASALNYNLVDKLLGQGSTAGSVVYYAVALSALLLVIGLLSKRIHFTKDENCQKKTTCAPACPSGQRCQPTTTTKPTTTTPRPGTVAAFRR